MRDDIVITNAYKGGAIVILDVKDYVKECERQLNNTKNYENLQKDPIATNNELVHRIIRGLENEKLIQENIVEGLKINSPRTPQFFLQPKIHNKENLGRPVISSISCPTSKISEYVDYHLQSVIKQILSYVKDTNDFISKLKAVETVPDNSCLVLLDVKSLQKNIPNSEGIKAMKTSLGKTITAKVITTFLSLILTLSNFVFSCKSYIQVKGCAMGTICALSYAISPFIQGLSDV